MTDRSWRRAAAACLVAGAATVAWKAVQGAIV
jgi:hypothetical protein